MPLTEHSDGDYLGVSVGGCRCERHVHNALVAVLCLETPGSVCLLACLAGAVDGPSDVFSVLGVIQIDYPIQRELRLCREVDEPADPVSQEHFPGFSIQFEPAGVAGELGETHQFFLSIGPLSLTSCLDSVPNSISKKLVRF